ncbi:MAG: alpha/beta hydrolase, partial [Polymorphobacter sp.]
ITAAPPAIVVGQGAALLLAAAVARHIGAAATGGFDVHLPQPADTARWLDAALPALTPDRHGSHLTRAWNIVRAGHFFWPWFDACAANAIPFDARAIAPERLAVEHRALVRARAGRSLLALLLAADRDALLAAAPPVTFLRMAAWATARSDIWQPQPRTD